MNRARLALPLIVLWAVAVAFGFSRMLSYETTPGRGASAPLHTVFASLPRLCAASPQSGADPRYRAGLPVLLVFAHPKCPCTRATIANLAVLMAAAIGHVNTYVLFVHLPSTPPGWEKTDLWQSAEAIPGVHVLADRDGALARHFGVETSGQALLYGTAGNLLFRGGITEGRGHYGDSTGSSDILALLHHPSMQAMNAPVFGCSIFGSAVLSSGAAGTRAGEVPGGTKAGDKRTAIPWGRHSGAESKR
jgi:hypothetical protein